MPDEYTLPEFETFVVRFWHEPASQTWRGKVIHVPSRTSCDSVTLEQAVAFIHRFVPVLPAATTDDTRADVALNASLCARRRDCVSGIHRVGESRAGCA
jgi:hypothetical protein